MQFFYCFRYVLWQFLLITLTFKNVSTHWISFYVYLYYINYILRVGTSVFNIGKIVILQINPRAGLLDLQLSKLAVGIHIGR